MPAKRRIVFRHWHVAYARTASFNTAATYGMAGCTFAPNGMADCTFANQCLQTCLLHGAGSRCVERQQAGWIYSRNGSDGSVEFNCKSGVAQWQASLELNVT
jgi:hypothetical protein